MKRFSSKLMSALLVTLLIVSVIGCKSTPQPVEEIPAAAVVQPVAPPVEEVVETPVEEVVEAPPVMEVVEPIEKAEVEVVVPVVEEPKKVVLPYGVKEIVKSEGHDVFDLFIVHTSNVHGELEATDNNIGYSRLSTMMQVARGITNNILFLDAGNAVSGSELVSLDKGETAGLLIDMLGYDAIALGSGEFDYGLERIVQASKLAKEYSDVKVLSANVLDANNNLIFQPYQIYDYNGFKVGVLGLTDPKAAKLDGVTYDSPMVIDNAQYAVDLAHQFADYVVVLGSFGEGAWNSELICENIDGIDLWIDGSKDNVPESGKYVNGALIVQSGKKLDRVGVVDLLVKNNKLVSEIAFAVNANDVISPRQSELASMFGIVSVPEDATVKAFVDSKVAALAPPVVEEVKEVVEVVEVVAPPVVEEVKEIVLPYGVEEIVKAEGHDVFDLFIVHTNDVKGALEATDNTIGYSKLSTMMQVARSITNNILFLDAGNSVSGSELVAIDKGESAGLLIDMLGYDAVALGSGEFDYGLERIVQAAQLAKQYSSVKVLSANVLDKNNNLLFQPYQVYNYNGFKVAVIGLTDPKADKFDGVSFDSPMVVDNAQYAINLANEIADYVVVLGSFGTTGLTSEVVCQNIDGIDLWIDGDKGNVPASGKYVNGTLIVQNGQNLENLGVVDLLVKDNKLVSEVAFAINAKDVAFPKKSELASMFGIVSVPEDARVKAFVDSKVAALAPPVMEEVKEVIVPVVEPVVEEEKEIVLPYGVEEIVKAEGHDVFDLFIVHTNDVKGALEATDNTIGYSRLSTMMQVARSITDNILFLDAGNAVSGSELVAIDKGESAGLLIDMLGYDAVALGSGEFDYGLERIVQAAQLANAYSSVKVLSANVLDNNDNLLFQPYQVYNYNGFKVAVIGLTDPKADKFDGVTFDSPMVIDNAQYAIDLANQIADYVVVLGGFGTTGLTSEVVCQNIDGIDLWIDGDKGSVPASGKKVNGTLIVQNGQNLENLGVVDLLVKDSKLVSEAAFAVNAKDVVYPRQSELASMFGIVSVPEDARVKAFVDSKVAALAPPVMEEVKEVVAVVEEVKEVKVEVELVEEKAPEVVYPFGVKEIIKAEGYDLFDLFIVHTNDVHGRVEATDTNIGYSRLSTIMQVARSITDNILFLDAGDAVSGSNFVNLYEGETAGMLLHMLGYDAIALGNHEFDYGLERIVQAAQLAGAYSDLKVLSANVLDSDDNLLFQPYQLYNFSGFKVAVIGLTTPDTYVTTNPKHVEGLTFDSPIVMENAQYAIDLANEIADYVVVLGHVGMDKNSPSGLTSDLICSYIDGIDLWIDGHSHHTLPNGTYVNGTLIVQAGEYLENLGVVDVLVKNKEVVSQDAFLIPAADVVDPASSELASMYGIVSVPEDPQVQAYIAEKNDALDAIYNEVLAYVPFKLEGDRADVRTRSTNLAKIICTAMTESSGADLSITNGGGIRSSIDAGHVTMGDVIRVLPFNNVVTVSELTGEKIYEAMEYGYSKLPAASGSFAQTDMKVLYNKFGAPGNRILRLYDANDNLIKKDSTVYSVATNDFLVVGGDGYVMFEKTIAIRDLMSDVLADYLTANYPKEFGTVIAYAPKALEGDRIKVNMEATDITRMVTAAMTEATGAEFAFITGGSINSGLDAGDVTIHEVLQILPNAETLTVVEVSGAEIYKAFEYGLSKLPAAADLFALSDAKVLYNKFGAPGNRVLKVYDADGNIISKDAVYKVATTDFLAGGGYGYDISGKFVEAKGLLSDVFADYLAKYHPVK